MNCKNYILVLCLDHWVEDVDWCGAWERLEQTVESDPDCHPPPPVAGVRGSSLIPSKTGAKNKSLFCRRSCRSAFAIGPSLPSMTSLGKRLNPLN